MRKTVLAVLAAALLGTTALAQTATPPITPEEAIKLKTWFDAQELKPTPFVLGFTAMSGAVVPETVVLQELPAAAGVPGATKYRYAKVGDRLVLVDPADRKVVYVVS